MAYLTRRQTHLNWRGSARLDGNKIDRLPGRLPECSDGIRGAEGARQPQKNNTHEEQRAGLRVIPCSADAIFPTGSRSCGTIENARQWPLPASALPLRPARRLQRASTGGTPELTATVGPMRTQASPAIQRIVTAAVAGTTISRAGANAAVTVVAAGRRFRPWLSPHRLWIRLRPPPGGELLRIGRLSPAQLRKCRGVQNASRLAIARRP